MKKTVNVILEFVRNKPRKRSEITTRIKNHSAEDRREAICYVINNKLVKPKVSKQLIGRRSVVFNITEKGMKELDSYNEIDDKTVWKI
jgi:DNA-binding PadR family transcriptional regulator